MFNATSTIGACALALGAIFAPSITTPVPAHAEDQYWDIEAFDRCRDIRGNTSTSEVTCCAPSGGVWTGANAGEGHCAAPPAVQENVSGPIPTSTGRPRPPLIPGDSIQVATP